ncbi:MAG: iron ABC transporter permease [Desulfonauticus sp.]|nr:iron ABC transporter permease [Desulfonauticus sp.]
MKRYLLLYIGLGLCSLILFFESLNSGPVKFSLLSTFFNPESRCYLILMDIRLPRTILAYCTGIALSLCGATLQAILDNPLAEPFTLGISSGAAFMASLVIYLGINLFSIYTIPLASLVGAFFTLVFVLYLAKEKYFLCSENLILAGIVLTTFFSALISIVKSLDEEGVSSIIFWIMGSFAGRSWAEVKLFLPFFLLAAPTIFLLRKYLDILLLGDLEAHNLGINPHFYRLIFFVLTSILAGASVSVTGIIGFIGLISPHMLRLLKIDTYYHLIPLSGLTGGCLMLGADILARIVLPGGEELPVGALTALLGGPFFCLLLLQKQKSKHDTF